MTKKEIKTLTGKTPKEVILHGITFYAIREQFGYMGSECFGSNQTFSKKFGWNLYNEFGAFIAGGIGSDDMVKSTFKDLVNDLSADDYYYTESRVIKLSNKEVPEGEKPFEYYS